MHPRSKSLPRFPRSVFTRGEEPDVRFTLANERTFLAGIRTALALLAAGVALEVLGLDLQPGLRFAASLVLLGAGTVMPLLCWRDWAANEKAMRTGDPLPRNPSDLTLAAVITIAGTLVLLALVLR